ncbi:MAG: hypothetical protein M1829_002829 [Trizodia sp. TS-e1964]|nr:MAG: hypothetical protein M1829_002829 [Trizodia sp. TS-e1964]
MVNPALSYPHTHPPYNAKSIPAAAMAPRRLPTFTLLAPPVKADTVGALVEAVTVVLALTLVYTTTLVVRVELALADAEALLVEGADDKLLLTADEEVLETGAEVGVEADTDAEV